MSHTDSDSADPIWRVGVASIIQETNTFSPRRSTIDDFRAHGLWTGREAADQSRGTNTELAGALETIETAGHLAIPLLRAWAMSDGALRAQSLRVLRDVLLEQLHEAGPIDALVLCLHGALVAEDELAADAYLAAEARAYLGHERPLVVTHDLHANLTERIVSTVDGLVGFRTYPHVDQADTGRRAAKLTLRMLSTGLRRATVLAKRPMIVPAEAQAIEDMPMRRLRYLADQATGTPILDVSLFPVQPWLDVPELGFGVTVTHTGSNETNARELAERLAQQAWLARGEFSPTMISAADAIRDVRTHSTRQPVLLLQSADSPTAGCTADSAAVVAALLSHGDGLASAATVVDAGAVADSFTAGQGAPVATTVGASLDPRWSEPVFVRGTVVSCGDSPVVLTGQSMTGQAVSLGRWATIHTTSGLTLLVTERPAPTFDPQAFRHVGINLEQLQILVVRSAKMYEASYRGLYSRAHLLDLPGASTPNLTQLRFERAPRPLYPLDREVAP